MERIINFSVGMPGNQRTQGDMQTDRTDIAETSAVRCSLTPRECEVRRKVFSTDGNMNDIARNLCISERILYRYMNSIYEKQE